MRQTNETEICEGTEKAKSKDRQNAKKIEKMWQGHQRLKTRESQGNNPIILLQFNTLHLTMKTGKNQAKYLGKKYSNLNVKICKEKQ